MNDLRELTEVAHRHGALIAVDAVSGLGAVPLPQGKVTVEALLKTTHETLYNSKRSGKNQVSCVDPAETPAAPTNRPSFMTCSSEA